MACMERRSSGLRGGFGHKPTRQTLASDAENAQILAAVFDDCFVGDIPVVSFTPEAETCSLNAAASARYGFTPRACYAGRSGA